MFIFSPVNNDAVKLKETVLVFVANGNVGGHFVNQALEAGYKIKAFVRNPEKYMLSEKSNIRLTEFCDECK